MNNKILISLTAIAICLINTGCVAYRGYETYPSTTSMTIYGNPRSTAAIYESVYVETPVTNTIHPRPPQPHLKTGQHLKKPAPKPVVKPKTIVKKTPKTQNKGKSPKQLSNHQNRQAPKRRT